MLKLDLGNAIDCRSLYLLLCLHLNINKEIPLIATF